MLPPALCESTDRAENRCCGSYQNNLPVFPKVRIERDGSVMRRRERDGGRTRARGSQAGAPVAGTPGAGRDAKPGRPSAIAGHARARGARGLLVALEACAAVVVTRLSRHRAVDHVAGASRPISVARPARPDAAAQDALPRSGLWAVAGARAACHDEPDCTERERGAPTPPNRNGARQGRPSGPLIASGREGSSRPARPFRSGAHLRGSVARVRAREMHLSGSETRV
jgi:hypothetical protein